jgi:hypothetical protein
MPEQKRRGRPRKYANNEEKNKVYYQQNKEKIIQKTMEYNRKNYDNRKKELQHQYYLRHRDERLKYQHDYLHNKYIRDYLSSKSIDTSLDTSLELSDDCGSGLLEYYESKIN